VIQVIRAVSPEHDPVVIKITEDAALWENERQWLKAYKKKNAELQWPTNGGHIVTLIGSFQEGGRCKQHFFPRRPNPYLMLLPPTSGPRCCLLLEPGGASLAARFAIGAPLDFGTQLTVGHSVAKALSFLHDEVPSPLSLPVS